MIPKSIWRWGRPTIGVLVLTALLIQFIPVDRSQPADQQRVSGPPAVLAVLERSCFDCHSNTSRWPWYGYVAPFSWLIADHIAEARDHLNFSTWNLYDEEERNELMEEVWDEVDLGNMPPNYYAFLHPEAGLTQADRRQLEQWAFEEEGHTRTP